MAGRSISVCRGFTSSRALLEKLKEPLKIDKLIEEKHHEKSANTWKKIYFFVGCPAVLLAFVNVMVAEEPPRPEFKKYPYMRIRNKKYPWRDGVKTLFHNPERNALPDGYEDMLQH